MKIVYLGKFELLYRTENYVASALEECGVSVEKVQVTNRLTYDKTVETISRIKPDVVLFSKATRHFYPFLLKYCRAANITTVAWMWDLFWGYRSERPYQWKADYLFTTDGGHEAEWKAAKVNHHVLRQGIHAPEWVCIDRGEVWKKVCFVGSRRKHSQQRHRLVKWLVDNYEKDLALIHNKRGIRLNHLLASCSVIVGDSYPSPNYWSNRIYEMLGRGGFLLHPFTEGLDEEFTEGVHYVGYEAHDRPKLMGLIDYYLSHPEEAEAIRRAGWKKCGEYTYTHRVKELLKKIGGGS